MSDQRLIAVLADGAVHSGEALAAEAGVTRAAIWKRVSKLGQLGIEVERVPGRGYRVPGGLDLLDAGRIRAARAVLQNAVSIGKAAPRRARLIRCLWS